MKKLSLTAVMKRLRGQVGTDGVALYAERCGVTPQYLYAILAGDRPPTKTVLAPLGIRREIVYVEGES